MLFIPQKVFAVKQFIENFDDVNSSGWNVVYDQANIPCIAPWLVKNGRMEISINQYFCTTNIMPNDELWNDLGNNYIFELDMTFISGTDHNVAFRFTPSIPYNDWYDIHVNSPTGFYLERIPPSPYIHLTTYSLPNRLTPYHFKIVVETGSIEVYIDGVLVTDHDYDPSLELFSTGRIALRAGTGVDPVSVTYFDNIIVTSLGEEKLDVPYVSQIDNQWKDKPYNFIENKIGIVGCALTSAVMTMKYYGIDKLPDGSNLTVLSLNDWLNQNPDGYWREGLTSWTALTKLSKKMHDIDAEKYPFLNFRKIKPPDFTEIDKILTEDKNPLIFEEEKPESSSGYHFTVAQGVVNSGAEYLLLDPFNDARNKFLIPPNQLISANYLFPTSTNFSYLVINTDDDVNPLLSDPSLNKLGRNKSGEEFHEISEALFYTQLPILFDDGSSQTTGNVFWQHLIPEPVSGEYQLELNTQNSGWHEFEMYAYDRNAEVQVFKKRVYVDSAYPVLFTLKYNQDGGQNFAALVKKVDWETFKQDVVLMRRLNNIKQDFISNLLNQMVGMMQHFPGNKKIQLKLAGQIEKYLKRYYPKYITLEGKEFLLEELNYLKAGL